MAQDDMLGGLLGNPLVAMGLGMLANNQGRYPFQSAVGGGVQGLQQAAEWKRAKMMEDYQAWQIEQAKKAQAQKDLVQVALKDAFIPEGANPGYSFMDANNAAMSGGAYSVPQTLPAHIDYNKAIAALMPVDASTALALAKEQRAENAPIKIGKDERIIDNITHQTLVGAAPDYAFAPNGMAYDKNGLSGIVAGQNYAKPDAPPSDVQTYEYSLKNPNFNAWNLSQKKASAPSMTSINNVNAFEPFNNKLQGKMGESLVDNFNTLQNIPATIKALDAAKSAAKGAKNFLGSGADVKLNLAKFFNNNFGTNIDPSGVASTEALQSALFYNVMDNLKKMDASPSQQQQQVMQAAFGQITTDPGALPKIIEFYKGQLASKATEHNKRVQQSMDSGTKFPYDIKVSIPESAPDPLPGNVVQTLPKTAKKGTIAIDDATGAQQIFDGLRWKPYQGGR